MKRAAVSLTVMSAASVTAFVEVWNIVFSQFENDGNGNYTPLAHPNIDTGMGLERLACVMQGVDNLFLVDTVQNIMKKISEITGVNYGEDDKRIFHFVLLPTISAAQPL